VFCLERTSALAICLRHRLVLFLVVCGCLGLVESISPSRACLFDGLSSPAFCVSIEVVPGCLVLITSYVPVITPGWPHQLLVPWTVVSWASEQVDNILPASFTLASEQSSLTPHTVVPDHMRLLIYYYAIEMQGGSQEFVCALFGDTEVAGSSICHAAP
jgi:hypothetical protein